MRLLFAGAGSGSSSLAFLPSFLLSLHISFRQFVFVVHMALSISVFNLLIAGNFTSTARVHLLFTPLFFLSSSFLFPFSLAFPFSPLSFIFPLLSQFLSFFLLPLFLLHPLPLLTFSSSSYLLLFCHSLPKSRRSKAHAPPPPTFVSHTSESYLASSPGRTSCLFQG